MYFECKSYEGVFNSRTLTISRKILWRLPPLQWDKLTSFVVEIDSIAGATAQVRQIQIRILRTRAYLVDYKFMQIHLAKVLAVSYNDTFAYLKAIDCIGKEGEGRIWEIFLWPFCQEYQCIAPIITSTKKELQKYLRNKALVDPISVFNLSKKSPFFTQISL